MKEATTNPMVPGSSMTESAGVAVVLGPASEASEPAGDPRLASSVYHILSETEPFSEHFGGALSRWAANVLRGDRSTTIVCPSSDVTWGFSKERIWVLPELANYARWAALLRSRLLFDVRLFLLRRIFRPVVEQMNAGDTVYVVNRPDFAVAFDPICRAKKVHLVLHLHNSHLRSVPGRHRRTFFPSALVFCSEFLRREAQPLMPHIRKTAVIPNGADNLSFFPGQEASKSHPSRPVVLFVGRLVPDKGVHVFVKAMRLLEERGVAAQGKIIGCISFGADSTSSYLEILKRSKPGNVEFMSYVSGTALAREFRAADIFCCPSVWDEPFGMVNVEAMASGVPVVATEVGGIPEIFRNGGGVLVPGGSATELADALEGLIGNPAKRREIGAAGYRSFQRSFSWREIRKEYLKLLSSVQVNP